MAAITPKQIIAGTATTFEASISWTNIEDLDSWNVSYKFKDATGGVIKEGTQPLPKTVLGTAGMTLTIARNIQIWVAQQAGITLA